MGIASEDKRQHHGASLLRPKIFVSFLGMRARTRRGGRTRGPKKRKGEGNKTTRTHRRGGYSLFPTLSISFVSLMTDPGTMQLHIRGVTFLVDFRLYSHASFRHCFGGGKGEERAFVGGLDSSPAVGRLAANCSSGPVRRRQGPNPSFRSCAGLLICEHLAHHFLGGKKETILVFVGVVDGPAVQIWSSHGQRGVLLKWNLAEEIHVAEEGRVR
mmetsp:Transcript_41480/g.76642  ORF Transcript_41480/g.76642 Transcript_41480/m.76642 type:complete len:214 (-) Transcript_41480:834-1475(-)